MRRVVKLVLLVGCLCLLRPAGAFAFSVTTAPPTVEQGGAVTLTLSGTATGLALLDVGIAFNSAVLQFASSTEQTVPDSISGGPPSEVSDGLAYFLLLGADPSTPFELVGDIFDITFATSTASATGPTTVSFSICAVGSDGHCSLELQELGVPGYTDPILLNATVNITASNGSTPVPEPMSLWLAVAALVAGGVVFRGGKDSKRS